MPTAVVVIAALLAISVAAYAYAQSNGGTAAPSTCRHLEVGITDCVAESARARASHPSVGDASEVPGALRHVRHKARNIGVPVDCNGVCPGAKQQELAEAAGPMAIPGAPKSQGVRKNPGTAAAVAEGTAATRDQATPPSTEEGSVGGEGGGAAEAPESVGGTCGLGGASPATVSMYAPTCALYASDLASVESPLDFWGQIDCAAEDRYAYVVGGGDQHLSATGEEPDGNYRRMTVLDGDEVSGERCELGRNYTQGPTAFYHEGENVLTYYSERLPANFPLATKDWQTVMQMKQAQPSHDDGSGVALEMEARDGRWVVSNFWKEIASFPARSDTWTRFAWDVYYSKDPSKGWVQVSADLNGDGDFSDAGEQSPVIHTATLATELPEYASEDGIPAGAGIPSHLRAGIYHDPAIPCPSPGGCSVDVDNVQVLRPVS